MNFDEIDIFTDPALVNDPYPYVEHLRAKGPVTALPHRGVMAVTDTTRAWPSGRRRAVLRDQPGRRSAAAPALHP